ncbi:MAG TPA: C40 family peptidase [Spirochaetales bacterium]|nr:C40 family peptidase [Spirochaetales bacterium]HRY53091.1 C40 family peptidase [Spirochaetia bacterium]HRZ65466.1 C40 family peptidase [Spirochaetia bacterium]
MRIPALCALILASASALSAQGGELLRQRISETARKYLGVPYVYGAESPSAFDCSGFVRYVYKSAAGLELPRNSRQQWAAGMPIKPSEALPGDVIVFDTTGAGGPSHVAIYLGNDQLIHAVSEGPKTGVVVSGLSDRYFGPRIMGYRLFLEPVAAAPAAAAPAPAAPLPAKPAPQAAAPAAPQAPARPAASAPAGPGPAAAAAAPVGPRIAQIGFDIPAQKASYTDKIPAATGTGLAFTLRNATGKEGRFVVIFYKAEKDFSKSTEIHRELVSLRAGQALEIPPYVFAEAGIYKLIVKDNWNDQLVERVFRVVELPK